MLISEIILFFTFLKKRLQSSKPAKASRNDSAQVSGQDRKKLPAPRTNQMAGFRGFRLLASLTKIIFDNLFNYFEC